MFQFGEESKLVSTSISGDGIFLNLRSGLNSLLMQTTLLGQFTMLIHHFINDHRFTAPL